MSCARVALLDGYVSYPTEIYNIHRDRLSHALINQLSPKKSRTFFENTCAKLRNWCRSVPNSVFDGNRIDDLSAYYRNSKRLCRWRYNLAALTGCLIACFFNRIISLYVYNDAYLTLSGTMYQCGHKRRPSGKEGPHKSRRSRGPRTR